MAIERDMRDYNMDYDQRLSLRVHKRHIQALDALALLDGKSRAEFVRALIDSVTKRAMKSGVLSGDLRIVV